MKKEVYHALDAQGKVLYVVERETLSFRSELGAWEKATPEELNRNTQHLKRAWVARDVTTGIVASVDRKLPLSEQTIDFYFNDLVERLRSDYGVDKLVELDSDLVVQGAQGEKKPWQPSCRAMPGRVVNAITSRGKH